MVSIVTTPSPCRCGGTPIHREDYRNSYLIICSKCGMATPFEDSRTQAVDVWNVVMGEKTEPTLQSSLKMKR